MRKIIFSRTTCKNLFTCRNLFMLAVGYFVVGPCLDFLWNHLVEKTPDDSGEAMVTSVVINGDDPEIDSSFSNPPTRNRLLRLEETESVTEKEASEPDKEAERLANWKANFPYQPTTDPDVVITEEMIRPENMAEPPTANHLFLRSFFENEARFTAQFEQLYHILEEHGRGDNPVAAGIIFNNLWEYHKYRQKDHDELSRAYSYRMGRYCTNAEQAEAHFEGIVYCLHAERDWPDREFMPEDEAIALRDRIVDEIQGMEELPAPDFVYDHSYEEELEVGFSPLVIKQGWQEAYDEWDRGWDEFEAQERQNRVMSVGEGNVLMANGRPVISAEGDGFVAYITAPDGYRVPLIRGDNGEVIIPTTDEIEEMKANGEGEWVELPEWPAPPPPPLTEEEWKMQEALRQLKEAARQQE